jgi:hypothetical protein
MAIPHPPLFLFRISTPLFPRNMPSFPLLHNDMDCSLRWILRYPCASRDYSSALPNHLVAITPAVPLRSLERTCGKANESSC